MPAPVLSYARSTLTRRRPKYGQLAFDRWGGGLLAMGLLLFLGLIISIHIALAAIALFVGKMAYRGWMRAWRRWEIRAWDRREAAGHCPFCGYDLRHTPTRCPECGQEPPEIYRRWLHHALWPNE